MGSNPVISARCWMYANGERHDCESCVRGFEYPHPTQIGVWRSGRTQPALTRLFLGSNPSSPTIFYIRLVSLMGRILAYIQKLVVQFHHRAPKRSRQGPGRLNCLLNRLLGNELGSNPSYSAIIWTHS